MRKQAEFTAHCISYLYTGTRTQYLVQFSSVSFLLTIAPFISCSSLSSSKCSTKIFRVRKKWVVHCAVFQTTCVVTKRKIVTLRSVNVNTNTREIFCRPIFRLQKKIFFIRFSCVFKIKRMFLRDWWNENINYSILYVAIHFHYYLFSIIGTVFEIFLNINAFRFEC